MRGSSGCRCQRWSGVPNDTRHGGNDEEEEEEEKKSEKEGRTTEKESGIGWIGSSCCCSTLLQPHSDIIYICRVRRRQSHPGTVTQRGSRRHSNRHDRSRGMCDALLFCVCFCLICVIVVCSPCLVAPSLSSLCPAHWLLSSRGDRFVPFVAESRNDHEERTSHARKKKKRSDVYGARRIHRTKVGRVVA